MGEAVSGSSAPDRFQGRRGTRVDLRRTVPLLLGQRDAITTDAERSQVFSAEPVRSGAEFAFGIRAGPAMRPDYRPPNAEVYAWCPPTLAQGGAQALEDAAVLTELLTKRDVVDDDLWNEFTDRRFDRAAEVVEASLQLCEWLRDGVRGDVPGLMHRVATLVQAQP